MNRGDFFGLIETALSQPARMQWYGYQRVGRLEQVLLDLLARSCRYAVGQCPRKVNPPSELQSQHQPVYRVVVRHRRDHALIAGWLDHTAATDAGYVGGPNAKPATGTTVFDAGEVGFAFIAQLPLDARRPCAQCAFPWKEKARKSLWPEAYCGHCGYANATA